MSRSRRKTPITGITIAETEKQDKRLANRNFRRKTKICLALDKEPPYTIRETSDIWCFDKDGKQYLPTEYRTYKLMGK